MKWRIFDNFTGTDIEHGTAYLSPQGDTKVRKDVFNLVTVLLLLFCRFPSDTIGLLPNCALAVSALQR